MLYTCAKFCEIISNGIKVIEPTQFLYGKLQRGIIPQKNEGGATVVNLIMLSGHALYLCQFCAKFHENISNGIKVIEQTLFLY